MHSTSDYVRHQVLQVKCNRNLCMSNGNYRVSYLARATTLLHLQDSAILLLIRIKCSTIFSFMLSSCNYICSLFSCENQYSNDSVLLFATYNYSYILMKV